jgi:hypothetical protein
MNNDKARSFVTIMVIIAVSALALRFGIGKIIDMAIAQNESYATVTLKLISAALENYAKDKKIFPSNFSLLTESSPAYLDEDYLNESPLKGYFYSCSRLDATGYSCSAFPIKCRLTGSRTFTVTTGGTIQTEDCDQKD